jgi:orotidine-5'-phosphate decarboxylase
MKRPPAHFSSPSPSSSPFSSVSPSASSSGVSINSILGSDLFLKNPLILSLDVSTLEEAQSWVERVGDLVGCIKLGPRLLLQGASSWVHDLSKICPIFVDCKFFDIPTTTKASVETAFRLGASIVTVHSLLGLETLKELSLLEKKLSQERPFFIAPVTLLTSVSEGQLPSVFKEQEVSSHVHELMSLVSEAGLRSVICSAQEIPLARSLGLLPITPGIRQASEQHSDQARVMTPSEALERGAWALVVGRPILTSPDPRQWILHCLKKIS